MSAMVIYRHPPRSANPSTNKKDKKNTPIKRHSLPENVSKWL